MSKERSGKQIRHLKAEIKRLQAEIKQLKKQPLDKDEVTDVAAADVQDCESCHYGMMYQVKIIGKLYWRCFDCGRTKKVI